MSHATSERLGICTEMQSGLRRRCYRATQTLVCGRCGRQITVGALFIRVSGYGPTCFRCRPFEIERKL